MKPKYEKPIAMPLGEAAKGSGQCNAGSGLPVEGGGGGVPTPAGYANYECWQGNYPHECVPGGMASDVCSTGNWTYWNCGTGLDPWNCNP
jgi:hypothetical protein